MKNLKHFIYVFVFILLTIVSNANSQVITIDSVRSEDANGVPLLLGQTVTVRGVVTTHHEFGASLVYFQVATAGLTAFDTAFCSHVTRGDSVQVTGVVTQFNGLTELQPVTAYSILGSNRPVNPIVVTPGMLRNPTGEQYEGMLIKINGVTLIRNTNGSATTMWTVSGSGTNYRLFVGTDSTDIRIYATSNIANTNIPAYPFNVVAIQSQFKSSTPFNSGYQILPRDLSDFSQPNEIHQISGEVPLKYSLHQNYPNPFNPVSQIRYDVLKAAQINIKVYDILGRKVSEIVNTNQNPGTYEVTFDASGLSSGVYIYTMFADGVKTDAKKMIVNK